MVDSMVAREAMVRRRNLSVTWIDYQKAYDRVSHAWLREMLSMVRAPLSVQRTLEHLRQKWSSVFCVGTGANAEDGTHILQRCLSGRLPFTPPLLPEHCAHIPCPQEDQGIPVAVCGPPSYAPVLHGRPEGVRQE